MPKYDNNFSSEPDMIECLERGCEIEFLYHKKQYSITHTPLNEISIIEYGNLESEKTYSTAKEVISYPIENRCLKDIINDMKIIDRSF